MIVAMIQIPCWVYIALLCTGSDSNPGLHLIPVKGLPEPDQFYMNSLMVCSRMTNFWILPVTVIGNSSTMNMCFGTL